MVEADNMVQFIWSVYYITAQLSPFFFGRHCTGVRKVEKEMATVTEDEIEVSTESPQGSVDTVGPT